MQTESETRFRAYRETRRFANLDGLRFICITMVMWHHAQPIEKGAVRFLDLGFLGVDFFFVLSGFLITTLLLREVDQYGRFSLKNFYIRRALRIVPVYFFVVSCVSLYYIVLDGQSELAKLVPYYFLFLSNFLVDHIPLLSITWSLSVEEQYYLLWPLLLLLLPVRVLLPVGIALVIVNVAGGLGLFGRDPPVLGPLRFALPNATYAPIILGSLLALLMNRERGFAVLFRLLGRRWTALAGFAVLLILFQIVPEDIRGLPNLAIHLTMTSTLAALVLREDNTLLGFLQNSVLARIGAISYGIYLYHLIGLDIVNRVFAKLGAENLWIVFFVYYAVSVAIAEFSFRTLEAYFQNLRPKFLRSPSSRKVDPKTGTAKSWPSDPKTDY
ncbi:acyltransferase family protein [Primorskyibacter sp. S87]|uniref:acyltransferase family protein n=1 Tax=Primorskyibacter sp. S87 TaxID=3415126 RepID=UPI003C7AC44C